MRGKAALRTGFVVVGALVACLGASCQRQGISPFFPRTRTTPEDWQRSAPGTILTVVGNGAPDFTADGMAAREASIGSVYALAIDPDGDLLFSEQGYFRVRKLSHGTLGTLAGNSPIPLPYPIETSSGRRWNDGDFGGDGGPANKAFLAETMGIAVDPQGNTYVVDQGNQRVRKVDTRGIITTIAGNPRVERGAWGSVPQSGFGGDGGPAVAARFFGPQGVAVTADGEVYISDTSNQRIRKIDRQGILTTIAGSGPLFVTGGYSGDGGPATKARLNRPTGLALDRHGNLFFVDSGNNRIRKIATRGIITTVAGGAPERPDPREKIKQTGRIEGAAIGDGGPAVGAYMEPFALAVDSADTLFIADRASQRVRKVDQHGRISTVAGNGAVARDNEDGSLWGVYAGDGGPATAASLAGPSALAIDREGNLYLSDFYNDRIRVVIRAAAPGLLAGKPFPSR